MKEKTRYSLKEAAKRLGISEFTLRRKIYATEISHYRPTPGGRIWFFEEHLSEFENRRTFLAKAA